MGHLTTSIGAYLISSVFVICFGFPVYERDLANDWGSQAAVGLGSAYDVSGLGGDNMMDSYSQDSEDSMYEQDSEDGEDEEETEYEDEGDEEGGEEADEGEEGDEQEEENGGLEDTDSDGGNEEENEGGGEDEDEDEEDEAGAEAEAEEVDGEQEEEDDQGGNNLIRNAMKTVRDSGIGTVESSIEEPGLSSISPGGPLGSSSQSRQELMNALGGVLGSIGKGIVSGLDRSDSGSDMMRRGESSRMDIFSDDASNFDSESSRRNRQYNGMNMVNEDDMSSSGELAGHPMSDSSALMNLLSNGLRSGAGNFLDDSSSTNEAFPSEADVDAVSNEVSEAGSSAGGNGFDANENGDNTDRFTIYERMIFEDNNDQRILRNESASPTSLDAESDNGIPESSGVTTDDSVSETVSDTKFVNRPGSRDGEIFNSISSDSSPESISTVSRFGSSLTHGMSNVLGHGASPGHHRKKPVRAPHRLGYPKTSTYFKTKPFQ